MKGVIIASMVCISVGVVYGYETECIASLGGIQKARAELPTFSYVQSYSKPGMPDASVLCNVYIPDNEREILVKSFALFDPKTQLRSMPLLNKDSLTGRFIGDMLQAKGEETTVEDALALLNKK